MGHDVYDTKTCTKCCTYQIVTILYEIDTKNIDICKSIGWELLVSKIILAKVSYMRTMHAKPLFWIETPLLVCSTENYDVTERLC